MKSLNTIYYIVMVIILLAGVACLTGVVSSCSISVDGLCQYILEAVAVISVMVVSYVNSRLFRFGIVVRSVGTDAVLSVRRYIRWNLLRYSLAVFTALFCLLAYCCTAAESLSYGIGVLLVASLFWHPSEGERESLVRENEKRDTSL